MALPARPDQETQPDRPTPQHPLVLPPPSPPPSPPQPGAPALAISQQHPMPSPLLHAAALADGRRALSQFHSEQRSSAQHAAWHSLYVAVASARTRPSPLKCCLTGVEAPCGHAAAGGGSGAPDGCGYGTSVETARCVAAAGESGPRRAFLPPWQRSRRPAFPAGLCTSLDQN